MKKWMLALALVVCIGVQTMLPVSASAAAPLTKQDFVYKYEGETIYWMNRDFAWECFYQKLDSFRQPVRMIGLITTNRDICIGDTFASVVKKYGYSGAMPFDYSTNEVYEYCIETKDYDWAEAFKSCKYYLAYTLNSPKAQIIFLFNKNALLTMIMFSMGTEYDGVVAKRGSQGDTVKQIQTELIRLGYLNDVADGKYGKKTADAVRTFQVLNGLDDTGTVDAITWDTMFGVSKRLIDVTTTPAPTNAPLPTREPGVTKPQITLNGFKSKLLAQTSKYGGAIGGTQELGGNAVTFTVTMRQHSDCKFTIKYDDDGFIEYIIADILDQADGEIEMEEHIAELGNLIGAIDSTTDDYDAMYIMFNSADEPLQKNGFTYTYDAVEEKLTVYIY